MKLSSLLIAVIPAILILFYGFKIQKIVIALTFFVVGFELVNTLCENTSIDGTIILLMSVIVGLLFGMFSFRIKQLSIFLFLFAMGYAAVYFGTDHVWYNTVIGVVVGCLFGGLGVIFYRPMIILSTALSSAYTISYSIFTYCKIENLVYILLVTACLGALGCGYQFTNTKSLPKDYE